MIVTPEVTSDLGEGLGVPTRGERPMQHRKLYRAVPLSLFVVARGKVKHVIYAWDAEEAVRLARQAGWFGKTEPVEVREFRWV
jgi:hypothetical protein